MLRLSADDHAQVSSAIAEAESRSDGEIIAVTADQSDAYHDVGLHWAVLAMVATLAFFTALPEQLVGWHDMLLGWSSQPGLREQLTILLMVSLLVFLVTLFLLKWRPLRMFLTPASTKTRRVRRRAIMLFRAGAERRTVGRTGILIYLSMAEHRAEIVGDEAITGVTTPETWGEAMAALLSEVRKGRAADGIVAAIAIIGEVLASHFPKSSEDSNEIPDKLIEL